MSDGNSYRTGIYRIKVRKQPPSTIMLVVAVALLLAGIALAFAVASLRPMPVELAVMRGLHSLLPDSAMRWLLSSEQQLLVAAALPLLLIISIFVLRRRADAVFFALSMLTAYLCFESLKQLFARPRPTPELVQVFQTSESFAFPSLSVALAVVCAALLSYLTIRAYRARAYNELRDTAALMAVLLVALLLIVLSSLAVLALGSHWPTDVLGSYLFGGAYTICAVLLRRRWMAWRGTDKLQ